MTVARPKLAVVGGTGAQGRALALRWAKAGYPVVLGSRVADKAAHEAAALSERLDGPAIEGADNTAAAEAAEIVILTVPYAAQKATVESLRGALDGKILVDVTAPLVPPTVSRVHLPPEGSAAVAIQSLLGETVRVVSAFQNVSAHHLKDPDREIDCDVLVCGDDAGAREAVIALARAANMRAIDAGPLANAVAAEALTAVLIAINRRYKVPGAGIRITGLPVAPVLPR